MSDELEFDVKVMAACEEGGAVSFADPKGKLTGVLPIWLPVITSLITKVGLEVAAASLPKLKEMLENWQPSGMLKKLLKKQLLAVIDDLMAALKKDPGLGDLVFAK